MTFLNPLILLGLVAAAIPLIIHLFNFRRPKKVDFSSLAFIKELQQSTMQRVRIKQWLLLLLRTLALACLILAFARPTLTGGLAGTLGGRASTSIAVIVDNSLSMALRDAQGEYLDQAKELAAGIVSQMDAGDEVFLITTADRSATQRSSYKNRSPALDAIEDIVAERGADPLSRALSRAGDLLAEANNLNKEAYLITDLQRSTLLDSLNVALEPSVRPVLIPVGNRAYANVAVTDIRVLSRIVEEGQPVRIEATLSNFGTEPVTDYVASVYLEGERVAQASANIEPGNSANVLFAATPQERGWLSGVVLIEDDSFTSDNERYFTLHVPERRRLLMVQGEGQTTDYLELALSSQLTRGRVAFDVEVIPENTLAATALGTYDTVLLVGPRTLSSGEVATVSRYVQEGGGLFFIPNAAAQASDYNALFTSLEAGAFSGFSGNVGSTQPIAAFERVDVEHPLFEGVLDSQVGRSGAQVESADVFLAMNYTPGAGAEQTLIHLSNGFPFLQEVRFGQGGAFLMAAAPDPVWTDLPVRGLFIPLMYRSMYYLSSSEAVSGERLRVGQPGELRLTGIDETESLRLVSPRGDEITPEQRNIFGAVLMQIDDSIEEPGVYAIQASNTVVRRVAFNLDSRESNLQTHTTAEAQERLAGALGRDVRVFDVTGEGMDGVIAAITEERTGVEVWNVFLLLALAFLLAEMLVAKQWRPEAVPA